MILLPLILTIPYNYGHSIDKKAFASFRTRPVMFQGIALRYETTKL